MDRVLTPWIEKLGPRARARLMASFVSGVGEELGRSSAKGGTLAAASRSFMDGFVKAIGTSVAVALLVGAFAVLCRFGVCLRFDVAAAQRSSSSPSATTSSSWASSSGDGSHGRAGASSGA